MGNKKFRLSEMMMPNAWFYKLKEMGTRNRNPNKTPSTKKKKQPPTGSSSSAGSSTSSSSLTCSSLASSTTTTTTTTTTSIPLQNSKSQNHPQNFLSHQRKSYHFKRNLNPPSMQDPKSQQTHFLLLESPKKSPKQHYPESYPQRKSPKQKHSSNSSKKTTALHKQLLPQKLITSSVSSACGCRASLDLKSDDDYPISPLDSSSSDHESLLPELGSDHDRIPENDILFNINDNAAKSDEYGAAVTEVQLHPILTKMDQKTRKSVESGAKNVLSDSHGGYIISNNNNSDVTEQQRTSSVSASSGRRLSVSSSQGVRIRSNSPRMGNRRLHFQGKAGRGRRRSVSSESFAVVKSSSDPRMDFRESMVEMIIENNIRASKDLEDLLACYLQLNSDEYHEVIIKVFKQIWFDLANLRLK